MINNITIVIIVVFAFFVGFVIISKLYDYVTIHFSNKPNKKDEYSYESYNSNTFADLNEVEKSYARILGLKGTISKTEIKSKYHELVLKYHPDRVQHLGDEFKKLAEIKFKEINEAYLFFKNKYDL